jgi:hypothetical protein
VALALDDQQQGIGLAATHLASIPSEPSIMRFHALSIRGPHLAFSFFSLGHDDLQLTFVINWKQANGDLPNYPRRLIHPPHGKEPVGLAFKYYKTSGFPYLL